MINLFKGNAIIEVIDESNSTPCFCSPSRKKEIINIAQKFISEHKLKLPIDLQGVAKATGAFILRYDMPEKFSGMLIPPHNDITEFIIALNVNDSLYRQRYTFAHEVGHIILKHYERDGASMLADSNDNMIEREANIFAAELLMPSYELESLVRTTQGIDNLSHYLKVSKQALEIKLKEIGLSI